MRKPDGTLLTGQDPVQEPRDDARPDTADAGRPTSGGFGALPLDAGQERILSALLRISLHIEDSPDQVGALDELCRTIATMVGAQRCGLFMLAEDETTMTLRAAHNIPRRSLAAIPPASLDPHGEELLARIVFRDEVFRCTRYDPRERDICHIVVEAIGALDAMASAWKAGGRRLGLVAVFDSGRPEGFSDQDAWVLRVAGLGAGLVWQHQRAERELRELKDREAESLRNEAHRMAELERVKTNFLNMASHELRGPIGVVRGYLSMIRDGDFGELGQRLRPPLDMMSAKIDQIWRLVEQMVEATRQEESRLPLRKERLDLRAPITTAVEEMRPLALAAHELVLSLPEEAVPVDGDRARLADIVASLLDNAIKYSPQGGEIHCRLRMVADRALLSVTDQGLGIEPEQIPEVFQRFSRIVTPENSHIPGSGLGLHHARELVSLHGGELTASSAVGQGSTFSVSLPLSES
jgi:signal transduction histidine kinase